MKLTNNEAVKAQQALTRLMEIKLPVKVSLDIALISNLIEQQINAFVKVRDKIFKTYSIKVEQGDTQGTTKFTCTVEGKEEEYLNSSMDEFEELLESKGDDLTFKKIQLPANIEIEPSILTPLTKFVEVA